MFTITELTDKFADCQESCILTIQQILSDTTSVSFDIENVGKCAYCIGDDGSNIVDGIIKKVKLHDNDILVTYIDAKNEKKEYTEKIRNLIHCDLIDLIIRSLNKCILN